MGLSPEQEDGSELEVAGFSYRHPRTAEWAHDANGPVAEARERFLRPVWEARPPLDRGALRILEVGFGRGLNTALALRELAREGFAGRVEALGLEPHPDRLLPWPALPPAWRGWMPWWGLSPGPWRLASRPLWTGEIRAAAAPAALPGGWGADWLFVDLFSPARHPEDWADGLGEALAAAAAPGGALASYCCARRFRELLRAGGWQVERIRRPGLRDSLRAVLPAIPPSPGPPAEA